MEWQAFSAMGTTVRVLGGHTEAVADVFEEIEQCCSRFRSDSDLARLNQGPLRFEVAPLLAEAIEAAATVRRITAGLVDAGMGGAVRAWGYDRTFEEVTDLDVVPQPMAIGSWSIRGRVVTRAPGVLLDLGGVAKGWAADRAVALTGAVAVSAGGDVRSEHPDLCVEITAPRDGGILGRLRLGRGAVATSTTARRAWRVAGARAHHLIDPRTSAPAQSPVVQATAVAPTATLAEAAAKAMLLRGEDALAWAESKPWVRGAVVLWHDGAVYATTETEVAA